MVKHREIFSILQIDVNSEVDCQALASNILALLQQA